VTGFAAEFSKVTIIRSGCTRMSEPPVGFSEAAGDQCHFLEQRNNVLDLLLLQV
jgi:hypothetical protein